MAGALDGLVVLDLSRILAGPTCTQMLGDLGATVWKIENPKSKGDDTRAWGPPYVRDVDGNQTDLSAYFMCTNRNKQSVAVDIATPEGQELIRQLAVRADIVVENFKPGGLSKYGLDYEGLKVVHPSLIYCSISGYGQTGPNREKPGYDLMAQGFGGIMSLTGEADGQPMKVGVGIADVMCGMYATIGVLAALRHRDQSGEGQHIDVALVDTQMAWLINEGANFLTSGQLPQRRGNGHPNIVPYEVFGTSDGHVIVAVGNDAQFRRFCDFLGLAELADDVKFSTNPARIENRLELIPQIATRLNDYTMDEVIAGLEAVKVPVGPVNTLDRALGSDQAKARDGVIKMPVESAENGEVSLLGNPLKFSKTPVSYRTSPPRFGEHTEEVLAQLQQTEVT
ncbi:Formyl-coenzyme A transferase [Roseovarius albus]|uniref:Formyl-coenzyme A transferase n=1 Tax=Roseovarius albus TaxID=1247867 RepID=A0A1X6YMR7_9RHOB|nr:CaiB/BaiF CoA-transferase family protein [Roseovarius albus]SLN25050.1 Formyl-coenzyme A transferase [Roseovarius albus]